MSFFFFFFLATNVRHSVRETASKRRFIFQYPWNDGEMYLFRATVAYSLRQYYSQQDRTMNFTYVAGSISAIPLSSAWPLACMLTCECSLTHTCSAEHVHIDNVTQRISFYMAATNPQTRSDYIPKSDLEAAIQWVNIYWNCDPQQENEFSAGMADTVVQTVMVYLLLKCVWLCVSQKATY